MLVKILVLVLLLIFAHVLMVMKVSIVTRLCADTCNPTALYRRVLMVEFVNLRIRVIASVCNQSLWLFTQRAMLVRQVGLAQTAQSLCASKVSMTLSAQTCLKRLQGKVATGVLMVATALRLMCAHALLAGLVLIAGHHSVKLLLIH